MAIPPPLGAVLAPVATPGLVALLLGVLALQFAVQPILTKRFVAPGTATSSLVLGAELTKMLGCSVALSRDGGRPGRRALRGWTLRSCLLTAGVPSVSFLVQNYCVQLAYQRLDAVAFNILNQTKVMFTALFSFLISGRRQSPMQCLALALVTAGGVLASLPPSSGTPAPHAEEAASGVGVGCALLAAALSGFGSGVIEWALQKQQRDNFLLSIEIAFLGCIALAVSLLSGAAPDSHLLSGEGLFSRWHAWTIVPVAIQGLSGILVGFITKMVGGVRKVLATIAGLILTCLLQLVVSGVPPSPAVCAAVPLVAGGIYVHATFPARREARAAFGDLKIV